MTINETRVPRSFRPECTRGPPIRTIETPLKIRYYIIEILVFFFVKRPNDSWLDYRSVPLNVFLSLIKKKHCQTSFVSWWSTRRGKWGKKKRVVTTSITTRHKRPTVKRQKTLPRRQNSEIRIKPFSNRV